MEEVDRLFDHVLEQMPQYDVAVAYEAGEFSARLTAPFSGKTLFLGEVDVDDDTSELIVNHMTKPERNSRHQSNVTIDMTSKDVAVRAVLGELGMSNGTEPRLVISDKSISAQ